MLGLYRDIELEEIQECRYLIKCDSIYDIDDQIFTPTEMSELNIRGNTLIERNIKGYHRCKSTMRDCIRKRWKCMIHIS